MKTEKLKPNFIVILIFRGITMKYLLAIVLIIFLLNINNCEAKRRAGGKRGPNKKPTVDKKRYGQFWL